MSDIFAQARIRELLAAADKARELADAVKRRGKNPVDVEETLEGLHRELGAVVHAWALEHLEVFPTAPPTEALREAVVLVEEEDTLGEDKPLIEVSEAEEDPILEASEADEASAPPGFSVQFFASEFKEQDEGRERWYDQEGPHENGPMFGPGDGLEERLPYDEESEDELDSQDTDEVELSYVRGLAGDSQDDFEDEDTSDYPAWLLDLGHLLEDLAMPADPEDPDDLAVEAARIQWATVDPDARFGDYPYPLQLAILGLLSARARHLSDRLQADVGPRLALARMRRYRKAAGLPPVVGLHSSRDPETGTWPGDAHHWWEVLVKGLRT